MPGFLRIRAFSSLYLLLHTKYSRIYGNKTQSVLIRGFCSYFEICQITAEMVFPLPLPFYLNANAPENAFVNVLFIKKRTTL